MNNEKIKITNFTRFMELKKAKTNNNYIKRITINMNKSYLSSNMKKLRKYLYNKYNCTNEKYNYKILKKLIYNINCRIVCNFKDHMLYGYVEEYLRRYYKINEIKVRLPKFFNFYNKYLQFFCKPIIHELKINKLLLNHYESKAEFYYKDHYDNKNLKDEKNENNKEENEFNGKIFVQQTIFSNSIKKKIDFTTNNNTLNLSFDDDEFINKNESSNSTVREIIDGFYKKIKQKTVKKDKFSKILNNRTNNINKSKQSYYKKINKEKIHNIVKKGIISISIMNNNKMKEISPFVYNYRNIKKEKSDSKSHSKSKSNIIYNKSISQSKKKLPIGNKMILKKSRNISSFNTLTKTQNVEKIFSTLQGYENNGFSKKILVTESDNRKYNKSQNKINKTYKPVTKIQKKNLKHNPFIYTKNTISTNYIKNGSMTHNLLNLIFDISNNNLKRKNHQYTHTNIDINFNHNINNSKKQKSNKLSKEYVNRKIKHNENVSINIKNNLNHLSRNQNNKKIDKGISSYHSKCSTGVNLNINLGNKIYSSSLNKNKIKTKSKEK